MSEVCGAESMRPITSAYVRGSGDVLAGKEPLSVSGPHGHFCRLPKGHDGPHACQYLERVGPEEGYGERYIWNDEHQLQCSPFFVRLEPDPMKIAPWPKPPTPEELAAKEAAILADGFTQWKGGEDFPLPVGTKVTAVFRNCVTGSLFSRETLVDNCMYGESWRHSPRFDPIIAYRVREEDAPAKDPATLSVKDR